jgi:uncharacterized protein
LIGRVKTRIAASVGDEQALGIYGKLLDITRENVQGLDCVKYLFYSDFIDEYDQWLSESFLKYCQEGEDLGVRMKNAFKTVFDVPFPIEMKVVISGSDCPELDKIVIDMAFKSLDEHDFVLGPTFDGGYYLLGMKKFNAEIFNHIPWSTEQVLSSTLNSLDYQGLSYYLLPLLNDIDTHSDWTDFLDRALNIKA